MSEQINKSLLVNGDIFNFEIAEDEYGISFEEFSQDGFKKFIESTYIKDFIKFRKAYIMKDMEITRSLAHKFKGSFKLLCSKSISFNCEKLQFLIDEGNIIETNEIYISIIKDMTYFLYCLIELGKNMDISIDDEILNNFWKLNNLCNDFESVDNKKILFNKALEFDELTIKKSHQICCAGEKCLIF